ncbi:MAG: hypothetical protein IPO27_14400 [Bacteroidetes bacterium]|nr:hypothetical protein [Bacteroidota bacterium]
MAKIYTTSTENLIKFHFNETDLYETAEAHLAIDSNYLVNEEYENLKEALSYLNQCFELPSEDSLNSIMAYSALTSSLQ